MGPGGAKRGQEKEGFEALISSLRPYQASMSCSRKFRTLRVRPSGPLRSTMGLRCLRSSSVLMPLLSASASRRATRRTCSCRSWATAQAAIQPPTTRDNTLMVSNQYRLTNRLDHSLS